MTTDYGQIKISDSVITTIAELAAKEVDGVVEIKSGNNPIVEFINGKKGVNVDKIEEGIIINLNIVVKYGYKVNEIARQIQESVREQALTMLSIEPKAINVIIVDMVVNEKAHA